MKLTIIIIIIILQAYDHCYIFASFSKYTQSYVNIKQLDRQMFRLCVLLDSKYIGYIFVLCVNLKLEIKVVVIKQWSLGNLQFAFTSYRTIYIQSQCV